MTKVLANHLRITPRQWCGLTSINSWKSLITLLVHTCYVWHIALVINFILRTVSLQRSLFWQHITVDIASSGYVFYTTVYVNTCLVTATGQALATPQCCRQILRLFLCSNYVVILFCHGLKPGRWWWWYHSSYRAKTGDNDCNVNSSRYSLSTALCESNSLSGQVWTKCPTE